MATLAERMAARRAKLDEDEEAGLYFNGPNSGGPRSIRSAGAAQRPNEAPPRSNPKSNGVKATATPAAPAPDAGNRGVGLADVSLQEEEESDDADDDEGGGMSEIQKYQQKLKEQSVKAGMDQYQAELRERDAADAVVGIACGNLEEVISSRPAPKSALSNGSSVGPGTGGGPLTKSTSILGALDEDSFMGGGGGGTNVGDVLSSIQYKPASAEGECTCHAGSTKLCDYCVMMNGPASNASTSALTTPMSSQPASSVGPASSAAPTMPGSNSSYAGMPSLQGGKPTVMHGGMAPGWSTNGGGLVMESSPSRGAEKEGEPAVKDSKKAKPKKKGGWLCCFSPSIDEDAAEGSPSKSKSSKSAGGGKGGPPAAPLSGGAASSGGGDELVRDGVPLGGVTSTSEDVIQLDNATMIQCNVGLSVGDGPSQPASNASRMPAPSSYAGSRAPLSSGFDGIGVGNKAPLSSGFDGIGGGNKAPLSSGFDGIGGGNNKAPLSAGFDGIGGGSGGLTEANVGIFMHASPPGAGKRAVAPPSSGTSLFSVAEHSSSIAVDASSAITQNIEVPGKGGKKNAPISSSLQELQGIDERREKLMESVLAKKKQAPPVSNTLLELQGRQGQTPREAD